ncbi:twin-arginine translocase TatA/TatE family subunit [Acidobacteriota bacterium]
MPLPLAFIQNLGMWELLIIAAIILLLFGSRRLPELGSGMGRFIKNFKRGIGEGGKEDEDKKELEEPQKENS